MICRISKTESYARTQEKSFGLQGSYQNVLQHWILKFLAVWFYILFLKFDVKLIYGIFRDKVGH